MHEIYLLNASIFKDNTLFEKGIQLISAERKEKIKEFKNPSVARLSLGAGVLLSLTLEKHGLKENLDKIQKEKYGKPFLPASDFYFSLSHSEDYVLCTVSNTPIGADLQKIKNKIPQNTKRILSEEEEEFLRELPEIKRIEFFYRLWTMKESLTKWDGRGLRLSLPEISFVKDGKIQKELCYEGKKLYFQEYPILSEYGICICTANGNFSEAIQEITPEILTKY